MVLDRELDTKIGPACSLDIKVSPKLVSALDKKLKCCAKVITVITNIINSFSAEIGAAKNKMNISVPTGNRRLWQEENMIAFVGPSSL
jgi:hypothetical protein